MDRYYVYLHVQLFSTRGKHSQYQLEMRRCRTHYRYGSNMRNIFNDLIGNMILVIQLIARHFSA